MLAYSQTYHVRPGDTLRIDCNDKRVATVYVIPETVYVGVGVQDSIWKMLKSVRDRDLPAMYVSDKHTWVLLDSILTRIGEVFK